VKAVNVGDRAFERRQLIGRQLRARGGELGGLTCSSRELDAIELARAAAQRGVAFGCAPHR
jgi:hypothetical protein